MNNKKQLITILLLSITIAVSFCLPKHKYTSPKIIPELKIPQNINGWWYGIDVSKKLNIQDERYNFVSDVFASIYADKYKDSLLFIILDAGNFHHPKVCFSSSGYKIKEIPQTTFKISGREFKPNILYAQKGNESLLIIYWICIDKKIVNWAEQKLNQLWFSLFNKQKTGLMIRLDIPTQENKIPDSISTAKEFLNDLIKNLPKEQADYIFGEKTSP